MFVNMLHVIYYNILGEWFFVIMNLHVLHFRKGVHGYTCCVHNIHGSNY